MNHEELLKKYKSKTTEELKAVMRSQTFGLYKPRTYEICFKLLLDRGLSSQEIEKLLNEDHARLSAERYPLERNPGLRQPSPQYEGGTDDGLAGCFGGLIMLVLSVAGFVFVLYVLVKIVKYFWYM